MHIYLQAKASSPSVNITHFLGVQVYTLCSYCMLTISHYVGGEVKKYWRYFETYMV